MVKNCSILKQVVCAGNIFHFDYDNAAWLRKSKGICFLLIFGCSQLLNFNSATAQTVRNANNASIATIESDGTVRDQSNRTLGKVESDGTVRDSSNRTPGTAKGVPMRYAALYFFFDFFR